MPFVVNRFANPKVEGAKTWWLLIVFCACAEQPVSGMCIQTKILTAVIYGN